MKQYAIFCESGFLLGAQKLAAHQIDLIWLCKQWLAMVAAPGEEVVIETDVVEIAKWLGVKGDHALA